MKKRLIVLIAFLLITAFTFPVYAGQSIYELVLSGNTVFIDGNKIKGTILDYKGVTYVPVDSLGEFKKNNNRIDVKTKLTAEDLVKDIKGLYYIYTLKYRMDGGSDYVYGTGVSIDKNTIVTCQHIIKSYDTIKVETSIVYKFVNPVIQSPKKDIAFLEYTNDNPVKIGDSDTVKEGDPVFIMGVIEKKPALISKGFVLGDYNYGKNIFIQTSAKCERGNSGSGLFNMKGELIGIVDAKVTETNNNSLIVPINEVLKLRSK
jgi:S1-C subfamily serine protease